MRLFYILCCVLTYTSSMGQSLKGTDFWLGFPEQLGVGSAMKQSVYIVSDVNTCGTVTSPKIGYSKSFTVTASVPTILNFHADTFEVNGTDTISEKGIHITTEHPVFATFLSRDNGQADAFSIVPTPALGTEYYAVTYTASVNHPVYNSGLLVVATVDNTSITITPADDIENGTTMGTPFDIILDAGEVYQGSSRMGDLTGSHVISNDPTKPIALIAGLGCTRVPVSCNACDCIYEEMYPVSTLDTIYPLIIFKDRDEDMVRIIATEDNTSVSDNGGPPILLANKGDFFEYALTSESILESDKPIYVMQYMEGNACNPVNGDPSMIRINGCNQMETFIQYDAFIFNNIDASTLTTHIICKTVDTPTIDFDGSPIGNLFQTFAADNTYSFAYVPTTPAIHTIESPNGFAAYVYAYSAAGVQESYAYSLAGIPYTMPPDTNTTDISFNDLACISDTAIFSITGAIPDSFIWHFGDGNADTALMPEHTYQDAGNYLVELVYFNDCANPDTVRMTLTVDSNINVDLGSNQEICEDNSIVISSNVSGSTYVWSTGETNDSIIVDTSGTYWLTVSDGNCQDQDTIEVVVISCDSSNHQDTINPILFIPNAFSPNNDQLNDYFNIVGHDIGLISINIYNNIGTLIFTSNSLNNKWDGTYKNLPINPGVLLVTVQGNFINGNSFEVLKNVTLLK